MWHVIIHALMEKMDKFKKWEVEHLSSTLTEEIPWTSTVTSALLQSMTQSSVSLCHNLM